MTSGRVIRSVFLDLILFLVLLPAISLATDGVLRSLPAEVCFSPQSKCSDRILWYIDSAKSEILVQAFSFTSGPIRNALAAAKRKGVSVEVILDAGEQSHQEFKTALFLTKHAIPVYIDGSHSSAHNKVILIDRSIVITGSYNFTYAADDRNAENLLFIRSAELAKNYMENWMVHKDHSSRYSP